MLHLRSAPAFAGVLLAIVPAAAQAQAGSRTFAQTYPVASALCARAAAGNLPPALAGEGSQVTAACNALQVSFTGAQQTVQQAQSSFRSQMQTTRSQIRAACAPPRNRVACRTARIQGRATLRTLRLQHRTAVRTYYIAVESGRRTFWSTIRALRGGDSIAQDRPIPAQSS